MIKRLPISTIALALLAMHLQPAAAQSAPAAGQKAPEGYTLKAGSRLIVAVWDVRSGRLGTLQIRIDPQKPKGNGCLCSSGTAKDSQATQTTFQLKSKRRHHASSICES